MRTMYIYRLGDRCVTHDSYIQLGIHSHTVERHRELNDTIHWVETNWMPDVFMKRYKRATFQAHERTHGGKLSAEERPRDFPNA